MFGDRIDWQSEVCVIRRANVRNGSIFTQIDLEFIAKGESRSSDLVDDSLHGELSDMVSDWLCLMYVCDD